MIEFTTPNGAIFIKPEVIGAIEDGAPRNVLGEPSSLIFTTLGTAFPVAGGAAEVRLRVRDALDDRPGVGKANHIGQRDRATQTQAFDAGVHFAVQALAEHLHVLEWHRAEETGSFYCDLTLTMERILAAASTRESAKAPADEVDRFPPGEGDPIDLPAEETPAERRRRLRRALFGPTKSSV